MYFVVHAEYKCYSPLPPNEIPPPPPGPFASDQWSYPGFLLNPFEKSLNILLERSTTIRYGGVYCFFPSIKNKLFKKKLVMSLFTEN